MANLVSKLLAGRPVVTGGILSGPLGTTKPTSATSALDAAMTALGYVSDEGVSESNGRDTERIKAWGGDTVKVLQTEHSVTYSFTLYQALDLVVNQEIFGEANVEEVAATADHGTQLTVKVTSDTLPHVARCIEIKDGDARMRLWLPDSQITEVGDVTYADNSIVAYPVTVEAFPDSDGVKVYKFLDDGVLAPAGP